MNSYQDFMAGAEIIVFPLGIMNVWCYIAMIFPSHPRKKKTNKVISKIN
jgi:hypothetical protein